MTTRKLLVQEQSLDEGHLSDDATNAVSSMEDKSPFAAFTEEAFIFGTTQVEAVSGDSLMTIQACVAEMLDVPSAFVSLDEPLNTIMTDSLMAVRLYQRVVPTSADISLVQFWQLSITALATAIGNSSDEQLADSSDYDVDQAVPADLRQAGWHPITPSQQLFYNMYAHCSAENPSIAQLHVALRIFAPVDVNAMRRACQTFSDRHDGARAVFYVRDGRCYQRVRQGVAVDFQHSRIPSEQAVRDIIDQTNNIAWNISDDHCVKFHLYQLDDHNFVFHINTLHFVADGWVMWMTIDEIGKLYKAEVAGEAVDLPPVGQQLIAYSRQEIARLHSAEGELLRRYWKQELAGTLADVRVKADYPAPTHYQHADVLTTRLDESLCQKINHFVSQEGITLYAFLFAVVQLTLFKHTGQFEVRLASRLTNRLSEDVAQTLANVATAAVLRMHLSPDKTLRDVCQLAYEKVMGAITHQGYPIVAMAEDLGVMLTEGSAPLAPIMYNLERVQADPGIAQIFDPDNDDPVRWGVLPVNWLQGVELSGWQSTDFGLLFMETASVISCFMYFNPQLYKRTTMETIGETIKTTAETIVTDPTRTVSSLF